MPGNLQLSKADALWLKLALTQEVQAIPSEYREDFAKFVVITEDKLAVVYEACTSSRFSVAAESRDQIAYTP